MPLHESAARIESDASLARYSRQMPLKDYHDMITLAYEELVR